MQRSAVGWLEETLERTGEGGVIPLSAADISAMRAVEEAARSLLSMWEQEVMRLAGQGRSNADIADALCITTDTVRCHVKAVYKKIGVRGAVR